MPLFKLAHTWQPNRLKGVQVEENHGVAFLAATQVFDVKPISRKWLALARTRGVKNLVVTGGAILVTRSGSVGRATLAFDIHENRIISDDLLRVEPYDPEWRGWIYAYLRAPKVRSMMRSAHYGHMIKHLEPSHLNKLPVPIVEEAIRKQCDINFNNILKGRNEAYKLTKQAEQLYADAVGAKPECLYDVGYAISSSYLEHERRRFDAAYNTPEVRRLRDRLAHAGNSSGSLREFGFEAWLPNRFLRVPASSGVELISSSALFEINPDSGDRIADRGFGDKFKGRVRRGWLLVARSGQNYGLVGSVAMATEAMKTKLFQIMLSVLL